MRILFAPIEIASQMQILAESFRAMGCQATTVHYGTPSYLGTINDICFGFTNAQSPVRRLARKLIFFSWAVSTYDVFHFFFGKSLLPFYIDLPLLRLLGKKIVIHFHGTDIRNPAVLHHRSAIAKGDVPLDHPRPPVSLAYQLKCLNIWRKYAHALLVSTPDLKEIVPEAALVPQAIPLDNWPIDLDYQQNLWRRHPIRIVHATTDRAKKGTEFIIACIEDLQRKGLPVELVLVEGKVYAEVQRIYQSCHFGVEQLLVGWHATFSVELMALGKAVITYISPELKQLRPDFRLSTPIFKILRRKLAD